MSRILLDQHGDAPAVEGYVQIETEVEFLKSATSEYKMHIVGENLCYWAETFFRGRDISCEVWHSPMDILRSDFPKICDEHIRLLADRLGENINTLERPIRAQDALQALYPTSLWSEYPSVVHAAEWLLWIYDKDPQVEIHSLLVDICELWLSYTDKTYTNIYTPLTRSQAEQMLHCWLGISDRDHFPLSDDFPLDIPPIFIQQARAAWRKKMIKSKGMHFSKIHLSNIPFLLKKVAAEEAFDYYLCSPDELDNDCLSQLFIYLEASDQAQLRNIIPPAEPAELPTSPEDVLQWFKTYYLPYREWQFTASSSEGIEISLEAAQRFTKWYLEFYPRALVSSSLRGWINVYKMVELIEVKDTLILVVVLDGLHLGDARFLMQQIQSEIPRLHVIAEDLAFTSIPTITEFAKEALFKGVPPDTIHQTKEYIGHVLPENASPANKLINEKKGIYIWRVQEPDRTYHDLRKNKSENLLHDVKGRLKAEVAKIREIVEKIPASVLLQIIFTTDHGRMIGLSQKVQPVPKGMESHGRAAYGVSGKDYQALGYIIENDEVAYLRPEVFNTGVEIAVSLNEDSFQNNDGRKGSEYYPHGGLFPEEVIVPWVITQRDRVKPQIEIRVSGDGRARMTGSISGEVVNISDVDIILERIIITFKDEPQRDLPIEKTIKPRSETLIEMTLDNWPEPNKVKDAMAKVIVRQPNGLVFEHSAQLELHSTDMYIETENILEDLEL